MTAHRAHLVASGMLIAGRSVIARALAFTAAVTVITAAYAWAWTP